MAATKGWTGSVISVLRRLAIWYTILTVIFRCPNSSSDLSDSASPVCKPYLESRDRLLPYIKPYYDTYAAPTVEVVRPYAETAYAKAYVPVAGIVTQSYEHYGAPCVTQAKQHGRREWDRAVKPYVDRYAREAWSQYHRSLEPFVLRTLDTARPLLKRVSDTAIHQYHEVIIPSYHKSLPYAQKAYDQGYYYVVDVGYPQAKVAGQRSITFVTRRVWPTLRILYGQNVEPQLAKIRERLGSHRDSRKLEAAIEDMDKDNYDEPELKISSAFSEAETASSDTPAVIFTDSASTESPTSLATSVPSEIVLATESTSLPSETVLPTAPEIVIRSVSSTTASVSTYSPTSSPTSTAEKVTDDLERWQAKFKRAADKGADDLSSRVSQITSRQIESQVRGVGHAMVTQLEEASHDALTGLRQAIIDAVRELPELTPDSDKEKAMEAVRWSIRAAGKYLKEKAQNLRSWKATFDEQTDSLVASAARSTLNVMDSIRDLGLQEIGMRWASMDNVTYQDWAAYHELKETFDEWRENVERVAVDHEGLKAAKQEAQEVEENGMAIAQEAADELARLRNVATWKIDTQDSSDDFETRQIPAAAAKIGQKIMQKMSELTGTPARTPGGAAESVFSKISGVVSDQASYINEIAAAATPPALDIVEGILDKIPSIEALRDTGSDALSSVISAARFGIEHLSEVPFAAPEAAATAAESPPTPPGIESIVALRSDISESAEPMTKTITSYLQKATSSISSLVLEASPSDTNFKLAYLSSSATSLTPSFPSDPAVVDFASSIIGSGAASISIDLDHAFSSVQSLTSSLSFASTLPPSISSASAAAGSIFEAVTHDIVDEAASVSSRVQSKVEVAGTGYAEVTKPLARAIRQSAIHEEERTTSTDT